VGFDFRDRLDSPGSETPRNTRPVAFGAPLSVCESTLDQILLGVAHRLTMFVQVIADADMSPPAHAARAIAYIPAPVVHSEVRTAIIWKASSHGKTSDTGCIY